MTKTEFLAKLQEALSNDLNSNIVQENINYYRQYIEDEVRKGRSVEEVISELGDPWALAKTIADSEEIKSKKNNTYESYQESGYTQTQEDGKSSSSGDTGKSSFWSSLGSGVKIVLVIVLVIIAIAVIISVIGGLFSALIPVILPILLIVFVYRMFFRRR